jgi:hypothetical protein
MASVQPLLWDPEKKTICVEKNKQRVKSDARFREKYCYTFSKKSLEKVG